MTTQITDPIAENGLSVQRRNYMAALSLAEQIMSETAKMPTSFEVLVHPWAPEAAELRFYFHHDIPALRQFRDDQMLTETMTTRADGSVYIEAVRQDDHPVRVVAWSLASPSPSAVAA
ncbi:hypothetical protein ACFZB4_18340 [Streptomyces pseudovenezuelae]|uniref:hypothetical protein n=1 Tax=Streptomyces pseudovenezuelae TaxID=67350 RepID=UPI0036E28FF1